MSRKLLGCDKTLSPAALTLLAEEDRYRLARKRALHMDRKHQGDGSAAGANPSSGVHRLVDRIAAGAVSSKA